MESVTQIFARRRQLGPQLSTALVLAVSLHVVVLLLAATLHLSHFEIPHAIPIRVVPMGVPGPAPASAKAPPKAPPKPTIQPRDVFDPKAPVKNDAKLVDPTTKKAPKPSPPPKIDEKGELSKKPPVPPAPPAPEPVVAEPTGPPLPTATSSSGTGVLGFAGAGPALDEDFQFPLYIQLMLGAVSRNWFRAEVPAGTSCTVYIRIGRDGRLIDWRLEIPSGFGYWDTAAMRAVRNADYPPLPVEFAGPSLGVHLQFQ